MPFQSWEGFQEDYGQRVGRAYIGVKDYTVAVAEGVGEMICNLHSKYPDKWFIPSATRGFLNGACSGAGLPVPETSSFGDGQCPVNYFITAKWRVTRRFQSGTFEVEEVLIGDPGLPGAITDIVLDAADGQNVLDFQIFTSYSEAARLVRIDQSSGVGYVAGTVSYEFERVDGQPDICINSNGYPDSGEVSTSDTSTSIVTNTVNNAGDIVSTTSLSVTYGGDTNTFGFPTTVNVGGNTVTVNFDGFSFGGTGSDNSASDSGGDGGGTTTKYKQPFDTNDFVQIPKSPPSEPGEEPPEEEVEEEEIEDDEIVWVLVDITTFPFNKKTIFHSGSDNNDYFAGYFQWTISTEGGKYKLPAEPIRKNKSAFKSPSDALGYSLYTVNGAKVKTTLYKQIIEEEEGG